MRLREVTEWTVTTDPGGRPRVALVVDTAQDDALAAALAGAGGGTPRHAGTWRAGELSGLPIVSFLLVEEADPGLERAWWTGAFDRELLEAVLAEPHTVALVPAGTGADAGAGGSAGLALVVDAAPARIAELLSRLG